MVFNNFKCINGVKVQVMANFLFDYIKMFYSLSCFPKCLFPLAQTDLNRVGTEVIECVLCRADLCVLETSEHF